jgi:uncharacterized protein YukE
VSLNASRKQLQDASRSLNASWDRARDVWRDDAARRFHRDAIEPIDPALQNAAQAMARIAESIERAKRECS